ncbi:MAG: hydrogenase maturation nickel metallochaperone HypA [Steroidobacteraceae bacterium]
MHELGITQSIVEACNAAADGACVARVTVEIGCLCAVQADAVRFCYDLCAQGTALEGSVLDIQAVPGRGKCRDCGEEMSVENYLCICACGSVDIALSGGDELRIKEMEIR